MTTFFQDENKRFNYWFPNKLEHVNGAVSTPAKETVKSWILSHDLRTLDMIEDKIKDLAFDDPLESPSTYETNLAIADVLSLIENLKKQLQ